MKWLYKLDYKYGKYYIRRLMTIIIVGMAVVYVAQMMLPIDLYRTTGGLLQLNRSGILNLELWRLVTFLFVPQSSGIFMFFMLYFYWIMGTSLENTWGGFRFNLYYLLGWLGAIIAMFVSGYSSNYYLNMSLFLAFATLAPDMEFRLFFILPIKAKWMAAVYALFAILGVLQAFLWYPGFMYGLSSLATLGFSLVNYFIFFGGDLFRNLRDQFHYWNNRRQWRNRNR